MNAETKGLSFTAEQIDALSVIRFSGDIVLETLALAKEALQKEIDSGCKHCIIDLDDVDYMDSSGIGFLLGALKRLKESGGHLKISRLNAYLSGLFRLLNLDNILEIFNTVEAAISSIKICSKD